MSVASNLCTVAFPTRARTADRQAPRRGWANLEARQWVTAGGMDKRDDERDDFQAEE